MCPAEMAKRNQGKQGAADSPRQLRHGAETQHHGRENENLTVPMTRLPSFAAISLLCCVHLQAQTSGSATLEGTTALTDQGDLSAQMVAGIDSFLMKETAQSIAG